MSPGTDAIDDLRQPVECTMPCVLIDDFDTEVNNIASIKEQCEREAAFHGVGPSEWYEISSKPLPDILAYIQALSQPDTGGAASSS